ncbi:MAG: fibronectin type III domain-containing protein [Ignavibacteriaceae bacterium]
MILCSIHRVLATKFLYFLLVVLISTITSCTLIPNEPATDSTLRKIEIYHPINNSIIGWSNTKIDYSVSSPHNIRFLELYINGQFINNIPSLGNNELPAIVMSFDSSYIGKIINYYIIYYDEDGTSVKSDDVVNALISKNQITPYPPFDLRIIKLNESTINISWKDTSEVVNRYDIYRRKSLAGEYSLLKEVDGKDFNTNDGGLSDDSVYYYKIKGINDFGESEFSEEINTAGNSYNSTIYPPSELTATAFGTQLVKLTWNDNSDNETYFRIERNSNLIDFIEIGYVGPNVTVFTDSGGNLYAGGIFFYRDIAFSSKDSAISNIAEVTTFSKILLPPADLSAQYSSSLNIVQLNWVNSDPMTTSFEIWRRRDSEDYLLLKSLNAVNIVYVDSDIQTGNIYYYYKVRGFYNNSYSVFSEEVQIVIP